MKKFFNHEIGYDGEVVCPGPGLPLETKVVCMRDYVSYACECLKDISLGLSEVLVPVCLSTACIVVQGQFFLAELVLFYQLIKCATYA